MFEGNLSWSYWFAYTLIDVLLKQMEMTTLAIAGR